MSVITLSPLDYHSFVKESPTHVIVEYWQPNCAVCKVMTPYFEELSELPELNGVLRFGSLNCEAYRMLAVPQRVRSLPTIIMFDKGKEIARLTANADLTQDNLTDLVLSVIGKGTTEQAHDVYNKRLVEVCKTFGLSDIGEFSDGYHTFNDLYQQKLYLFAALVKAHKDLAFKSRRHSDDRLCFGGGWFIVGIQTPEGQFNYHFEDKYWDLFDCKELVAAPQWDGHSSADTSRLLSL